MGVVVLCTFASQAINVITKTRLGNVRIELCRNTSDADNLKNAVSQATENACRLFSNTVRMEIRDVDEEADEEEVMQAILQRIGNLNAQVPLTRRNTGRVMNTIVISVPTKVTASLTKDRLRIGYVNCRVRCLTYVKSCYKFQNLGHTRENCK